MKEEKLFPLLISLLSIQKPAIIIQSSLSNATTTMQDMKQKNLRSLNDVLGKKSRNVKASKNSKGNWVLLNLFYDIYCLFLFYKSAFVVHSTFDLYNIPIYTSYFYDLSNLCTVHSQALLCLFFFFFPPSRENCIYFKTQ